MNVNLKNIKTNIGQSLFDLSNDKTLMLVFLRHFGCIFCREALHDLADMHDELASKNIQLVFTHMASESEAEAYFKDYQLKDVLHISDPECLLYAQFGLSKGTFSQLMGLKTWIRGFQASSKGIKWKTKSLGDALQMPGIFMICEGSVDEYYIHKTASDKPDYKSLINCCVPS